MLRNVLLSVIAGFGSFSSFSHAAGEIQKCSLKTLKGAYVYASSGLENGKANAEGGVEIFDGKGGLQLVNVLNNGEAVVSTGHYTMGENCIGRISYDLWGTTYVSYSAPSGKEFTWNAVSGNKEWSGIDIRTTTSLNPKCTQNTLKGTYIYSVSGHIDGVPHFDSGKNIYDGAGNVKNIHIDASGNEKITEGTYTIGKYCAGFVKLHNQDSFAIYTGPKGDYIYDSSHADASGTMIVGPEHRVSKR